MDHSNIDSKRLSKVSNDCPGIDGKIIIKGARVHNLKNISLTLPRNKLIVVTGVSGSGKSSLAFDTIYAEGQRRYVESMSSYARQFLERMNKPDVDKIEGISPAIAIEQRTLARNPRSTVATSTEIYDYLRLLFGRIGRTYCSICGELIKRDTVSTVVDKIMMNANEEKIYILFPLYEHSGKNIKEEIELLKKKGFFRLFYKEQIVDLNEDSVKLRSKKDVYVLIDRLVIRKGDKDIESRLSDSVQTSFEEGYGYVCVYLIEKKQMLRFSRHFECAKDNIRYEEPEPRLFSFNNPIGACPVCQGFGRIIGIDMNLVVPDQNKTLKQGAILPWTFPRWREYYSDLLSIAKSAEIPLDVPFKNLEVKHLDVIMNGYKSFEGLKKFFDYIERKSYKLHYRVFLSRFRGYTTCQECKGSRLRKEVLSIKVGGKNIHEIVQMTIEDAYKFFLEIKFSKYEEEVAKRILDEIRKRLRVLYEIGLGYLTLDRLTMTLSGGESQRINLATSLGSSLMGSLYVLDEPTIGLHPRDNQKLINVLKSLRDIGNTVLVVEHDEEMMNQADMIVDMGPRAGENGGQIVFAGTVDELIECDSSLTAKYLKGTLKIHTTNSRNTDKEESIYIRGAAEHNLKNIDIRIPLNMFVCVTGVSGSGKSTLVHDVLYAGIKKQMGGYDGTPGRCKAIEGIENISNIELVDQSPIGKTPRSNPVTYIKAFDIIRDLLAATPAAKVHGYKAGHFSFNVPGGRCDVCEGDGIQQIEMQFLADIYLTCESCKGKRFKQEILEVRYNGKNVDDILNMTVSEAIKFFSSSAQGKRVVKKLKVLDEVGLGYLKLGQPATTLSGGEAQRIKLAYHLTASQQEGKTLFIFDEPTTGLHFDDIAKLIRCFDALINAGHSVLVIEHNMHVVKCADFVIDMGPDAGERGGQIIATGTPEEIALNPDSYTGRFLKRYI